MTRIMAVRRAANGGNPNSPIGLMSDRYTTTASPPGTRWRAISDEPDNSALPEPDPIPSEEVEG